MKSRERKRRNLCAGSRPFPSSLYFKISLRGKSLLLISVFFDIEIRTNYRDKNFALTLTLKKKRPRETRKWSMVVPILNSLAEVRARIVKVIPDTFGFVFILPSFGRILPTAQSP